MTIAKGHLHSTQNVGELGALSCGLSWLRDHLNAAARQLVKIIIEYDSEYAASVKQRRARARQNLRLVLRARHIYDWVSSFIERRKVESHMGQFFNERADHLANCGASGMCCGLLDDLESLDRTATVIDSLRAVGLGPSYFFVVVTIGFVFILVTLRFAGKALSPVLDPVLDALQSIPKRSFAVVSPERPAWLRQPWCLSRTSADRVFQLAERGGGADLGGECLASLLV
ncbi:unnamed protein product [Prorocentrum cordatum]|uniref:RNase H type-1 domain-containing protein n=1 Tax=Prorocentrum cordatum TaxID=2364126 RepID=A0ABN9WFS4_9DINO|nr:unnamed protein product [Polarella glacialis]